MADTPNKGPDTAAPSVNGQRPPLVALETLPAANTADGSPTEPDAPTAIAKAAGFGKGQPAHYCGKPGRSGGKIDNRNAMRHGLKAGKLPKSARYIEHQLNALRRTLEDAVMASRGEVTLLDAASIQTACKWERHGALALRWLRLEEVNLKPNERLQFSREIARASAERDKALATLKLDADSEANSTIDALYAPTLPRGE